MFTEIIKKLFKVHEDHTPKILIAGATDKEHFEAVFLDHGIENVTASMNENASALGISYSPVLVLLEQGKDGHVHANISLPLQSWVNGLDVESSVLDTNDLRRITDWLAGFMNSFSMHDSVSAVEIDTGKIIFGDGDNTLFNVENILKDLRPKRDKSELMEDSMDIGSVEDILNGQLTMEEIEAKTQPEKKGDMENAQYEFENAKRVADEMRDSLPPSALPTIDKAVTDVLMDTQQDIVDKYGFPALQELLKKTGQPLLIEKPKKKDMKFIGNVIIIVMLVGNAFNLWMYGTLPYFVIWCLLGIIALDLIQINLYRKHD